MLYYLLLSDVILLLHVALILHMILQLLRAARSKQCTPGNPVASWVSNHSGIVVHRTASDHSIHQGTKPR